MFLASGVAISSSHGNVILLIVAAIAFLIGAILAHFVAPRAHWHTAAYLGLFFLTLAFLFGG